MRNAACICMLVAGGLILPAASGTADDKSPDDEIQMLRKTSRAFSSIAKKAIPAVVSISVDAPPGNPRQFNRYRDPGFLEDELIERFFRNRRSEQMPEEMNPAVTGSGFIISEDGYILTNNHLVESAGKITVRLHDGRELPAKRIGSDPKSEVAVINIEGKGFPIIELGSSETLEIGEWVIAVGSPFGLRESLTVGVVSAKGRGDMGITEYEDFIQTDAAINPGNSGGPLLNIEGKAIGVNTAIFSQFGGYMGIGLAVPIDMAKGIKDQLVKTGRVVRGFLGVQLNRDEMDEKLAESFGLKKAGGVLIAEVIGNSPAEKAGLKAGDVILKLDGKDATDNSSFRNKVASVAPDTKVKLAVFRDGKEVEISAVIGVLPENGESPLARNDLADRIGISVRDMSDEIAKRFGYDFDQGVIVDAVEPGSAADAADIQPGDLVLSVNRIPVKSADKFYEEMNKTAKRDFILLHIKNMRYSRYVRLRIE